jgi:hypothetical protein
MGRFKLCLVGSHQAPILEIGVSGIGELHDQLERSRHVLGRMVEIDGELTDVPVLIPLNRVQMIFGLTE